MITSNFRIAAIVGSVALLLAVIELVRRRRMKEEYTVLWVALAIVFVLLAAWGGLLKDVTEAIGAESQASALYFFGILFIILVLLHFSLRVSSLERRVVALLQEVALLSATTAKGAADGAADAQGGQRQDVPPDQDTTAADSRATTRATG